MVILQSFLRIPQIKIKMPQTNVKLPLANAAGKACSFNFINSTYDTMICIVTSVGSSFSTLQCTSVVFNNLNIHCRLVRRSAQYSSSGRSISDNTSSGSCSIDNGCTIDDTDTRLHDCHTTLIWFEYYVMFDSPIPDITDPCLRKVSHLNTNSHNGWH